MASLQKKELLNGILSNTANGLSKALNLYEKSFVGVIHAIDVDSATTIAGKIQHSDDNENWYDLVSFTSIAGAAGHEHKNISVNVLPYVRGVATLSGTTKLATVTILLFSDK